MTQNFVGVEGIGRRNAQQTGNQLKHQSQKVQSHDGRRRRRGEGSGGGGLGTFRRGSGGGCVCGGDGGVRGGGGCVRGGGALRCHATFGRRGGDEVNVVSRNEINDGVTVGEVRLRVEMGGKVKILDFRMDKNTCCAKKKRKKRKKEKQRKKKKERIKET